MENFSVETVFVTDFSRRFEHPSKGVYNMDVTVVPDSGTDELAGIAGTMIIIIEGGKHSYNFQYTLGPK